MCQPGTPQNGVCVSTPFTVSTKKACKLQTNTKQINYTYASSFSVSKQYSASMIP